MGLISYIIVGCLAGFVASKLIKGSGQGCFINFVVGVVGSVLGGWLFSQLGIYQSFGFVGSLVTSVVGASVFLLILSLFKRG